MDHRATGPALRWKEAAELSCVYVLSRQGKPLMPTTRFGRVRHLLKDGKAVIAKRNPFTIQLTCNCPDKVQPLEIGMDAGYQHIGLSVKSEKKEYVSAEYTLLNDEKERHDACRKYRRTRRNHLRYRAPRFQNRKREDGWLAPSIQHKANAHIRLIKNIAEVAPVTAVTVEVGLFDPALLSAMEKGTPPPEGIAYQQGPLYFAESLRQAVFQRDKYKCAVCGKTPFTTPGLILQTHHTLYYEGRHADTLGELVTVCTKCHTSANHQKGGALWGMKPPVAKLEGATYMNIVRWQIVSQVKEIGTAPGFETHFAYGATTSRKRKDAGLSKSHANDAYCIGEYTPGTRAVPQYYKKRRRNNRVLEKFYDAKVIDIRSGTAVKGASLGCERTNRRESRVSDKSLRKYRGETVNKGRRTIRRTRHPVQAGDIVLFRGVRYACHGTFSKGKSIMLASKQESPTGKAITCSPGKARVLFHAGAWNQERNR